MDRTDGGDRRLLDQLAIADVINAYADAVDDKDWSAFRSLFTDDATVDYTRAYGIVGPIDEIADWISRVVTPEAAPATVHAISNIRARVDGDEAEASCLYINPDRLSDGQGGEFMLFNAGRYRVHLRREATGWRMSSLVAEIILSHRGDLMTFELPEEG